MFLLDNVRRCFEPLLTGASDDRLCQAGGHCGSQDEIWLLHRWQLHKLLGWCFTFEILRMLKYIFLATELTCFSIDRVASKTAPRFFTLGLGVTIASPNLMLISLRRHWLWVLATTITSVFASFSLFSHPRSIRCYAVFHGFDLKVTHGCVFKSQSAVKLCVICKSMAVYGILVDNSSKW